MSSFATAPAAPLNPWVRILGALEKKVNRQSYDTWLKPTRFSHVKDRTLIVRIPTTDFRYIADRYDDLIHEAIENLQLEFDEVSFVTPEEDPMLARAREDGGFAPAPAHAPNTPGNAGAQRPAQRLNGAMPQQSRFDWSTAAQLNPRYTFDAFVIGSGNQFARAAAEAVAERPSKAYNPLFLYGGVGMGKTHLMHAIGHEVKLRNPSASICYVSVEKFTNEMISSLRYDKMTTFRDKFRSVDLLLIDDIQFLSQKERTQEEFFHTFNALHENMKQIVIASDRPPKELPEIEDRLRSRFEWGLIADIQPPDLETKVAILQKKAESEHVLLPTDVALFIASNVRTNVRELEGALTRLFAWSQLNGVEISLATTQQCLKQFIDTQVRKITIEAIQRAVAEQFGMRVVELKQKNNSRAVVVPRQIAMYLAKQMTEASLPEIGRQFGGKHHTTVMHSIGKIDEQRRTDKNLNSTLNKLQETLNS
ncbi:MULTISPECIES: chromosomal replication initiator protein DnaA [Acidobacterium]|uniref:Chromosomal replication initiator protein DnaA n=1 Tax=Acidobacterium capsulatum (strain ATCC 51196 / DSM 11244 / BCRC 80197 / JCM 7670 / NBRC 15755 / NCIMB 13165 / 161) TaxID=240015 RepID=C1F9G6_ACIC5|nr:MULTISPECIES: chromosomal replication initiator protein DnaA [Acidobacterium]ACO34307.1 chromosomal replication initiator protein DnaA [Acidobacterium capsulatum ATCC 51196]HCT62177.1 chromosomal replication initiator protein DnaA [Acidobacterium sp.]